MSLQFILTSWPRSIRSLVISVLEKFVTYQDWDIKLSIRDKLSFRFPFPKIHISSVRATFLVYIMDKTWLSLCSVQCTYCRCVVRLAFRLCSGLGSVFALGFFSVLGSFVVRSVQHKGFYFIW